MSLTCGRWTFEHCASRQCHGDNKQYRSMGAKWLELLRAARAPRVALIFSPSVNAQFFDVIDAAAKHLAVAIQLRILMLLNWNVPSMPFSGADNPADGAHPEFRHWRIDQSARRSIGCHDLFVKFYVTQGA
jgi:hypothetical protein